MEWKDAYGSGNQMGMQFGSLGATMTSSDKDFRGALRASSAGLIVYLYQGYKLGSVGGVYKYKGEVGNAVFLFEWQKDNKEQSYGGNRTYGAIIPN